MNECENNPSFTQRSIHSTMETTIHLLTTQQTCGQQRWPLIRTSIFEPVFSRTLASRSISDRDVLPSPSTATPTIPPPPTILPPVDDGKVSSQDNGHDHPTVPSQADGCQQQNIPIGDRHGGQSDGHNPVVHSTLAQLIDAFNACAPYRIRYVPPKHCVRARQHVDANGKTSRSEIDMDSDEFVGQLCKFYTKGALIEFVIMFRDPLKISKQDSKLVVEILPPEQRVLKCFTLSEFAHTCYYLADDDGYVKNYNVYTTNHFKNTEIELTTNRGPFSKHPDRKSAWSAKRNIADGTSAWSAKRNIADGTSAWISTDILFPTAIRSTNRPGFESSLAFMLDAKMWLALKRYPMERYPMEKYPVRFGVTPSHSTSTPKKVIIVPQFSTLEEMKHWTLNEIQKKKREDLELQKLQSIGVQDGMVDMARPRFRRSLPGRGDSSPGNRKRRKVILDQ